MALKLSDPRPNAPEATPFQTAGFAERIAEEFPGAGQGAVIPPTFDADVMAPLQEVSPREPPEPDLVPPIPPPWRPMPEAPLDRPVYMTDDPVANREGTLTYWRRSRVKTNGRKGWAPVAYWAVVLTNRELDFEPAMWRESMARGEADVSQSVENAA